VGIAHWGFFMARLIQQLTEAKIRTLTKIGLHHDGAGLYLQVRPNGARSWIYRFRLNSRTRDMGLGALADVSLVKAREKAGAARALVNDGIDPIEHTRTQATIPVAPKRHLLPTFEEVAEAYMGDRLKRLRSDVHRHQWRQTLEDYAYPIIGKMPVNEIETNDVLAVLKPIWEAKCEGEIEGTHRAHSRARDGRGASLRRQSRHLAGASTGSTAGAIRGATCKAFSRYGISRASGLHGRALPGWLGWRCSSAVPDLHRRKNQ
jgi:hypothetical protein